MYYPKQVFKVVFRYYPVTNPKQDSGKLSVALTLLYKKCLSWKKFVFPLKSENSRVSIGGREGCDSGLHDLLTRKKIYN